MRQLLDFPQVSRIELQNIFDLSISQDIRERIEKNEYVSAENLGIDNVIVALSMQYTSDWYVDVVFLNEQLSNLSKNWIKTVLVAWTTWEASSLHIYEHITYVRVACEIAKKYWINIIAWAWSNSTSEQSELIYWVTGWNFPIDQTITRQNFTKLNEMSLQKSSGAVATLLLPPYYIKTSNENLVRHFVVWLNKWPAIIYSIKWRTWMEIPLDVIEIIAKHPNFVWVKECDWSERIEYLVNKWITVWTWNDESIVKDVNQLWAYWSISVTAWIIPDVVRSIIDNKFNVCAEVTKNTIASELLFPPWLPNPHMIHNVFAMNRYRWEKVFFRWPVWPVSEAVQTYTIEVMKRLWMDGSMYGTNYNVE